MAIERCAANGITIAYERLGDERQPPVVLIMGLGRQLIGWRDEFCARLAEHRHVIRFDNRDAGESTHFEARPDIAACMAGDTSSAPYSLEDMADDVAGLLDALSIEAAHLVGASLGGMIAQTAALRHPARVLSLTSIMSTTGDPSVSQPTPEAAQALFTPPPRDRDEAMERAVVVQRVIGSPGFRSDEEEVRALAAAAWDRAHDPHSTARQLAAIWVSGDRTEALGALDVPTLVVHGEEDPLIPVAAGRATAAAIAGAELWTIPGMGHEIPRELWADVIARLVAISEEGAERAA